MAHVSSSFFVQSEHRPSYSPTEASQTTTSFSSLRSSNRSTVKATPDAKVKFVVTGDGGCGKTCLLTVYTQRRFPEDYVPTVFETYVQRVPHGGKSVEMSLWDTAGQECFDRLRPLSYPESDVILICFSVDYPTSLANVEDRWFPEVAHFCESVPIILVCTKTDLRRDARAIDLLAAQGSHPVTPAEGAAVAKRIGAKYAECSSRLFEGVDEIFEGALRDALKRKVMGKIKRPSCRIL